MLWSEGEGMDANSPADRLKALTEKHLGTGEELPDLDLDEFLEAPKAAPGSSLENASVRTKIRETYNAMIRLAKFQKSRELIEQEAWRCTTYFAKKNNAEKPEDMWCNTVNGTYAKSAVIRKTCSRCAQYRPTPHITIKEEFEKIAIEQARKEGLL